MGNNLPKILTFNAKFSVRKEFMSNQNALLSYLSNNRYDIIAIQECNKSFRDKVEREAGYNTCYFQGNLIMSRLNLREISKTKNYIICETEYNGININVCNVHLPSTKTRSNDRFSLFEELMTNLKYKNSIIMGDFNMLSDEYSGLHRKYSGLSISTELNTYGNQFPYDRIIVTGKNIKLRNSPYLTDMRIGSDHLALSTNISIENNTQDCRII